MNASAITPMNSNGSIQTTAASGIILSHVTQAELEGLVANKLSTLTAAKEIFTAFRVAKELRDESRKEVQVGNQVEIHALNIPHLDGYLIGVQTLVHTAMQDVMAKRPQVYDVKFNPSIGPNGAHEYMPYVAPQIAQPADPALSATVTVQAQPVQAQLPANATPQINPIRWGSGDGL